MPLLFLTVWAVRYSRSVVLRYGEKLLPFHTHSKSNKSVHSHKLINTLSTISMTLLLSTHTQIWVAEHRTAPVKPFFLPSLITS